MVFVLVMCQITDGKAVGHPADAVEELAGQLLLMRQHLPLLFLLLQLPLRFLDHYQNHDDQNADRLYHQHPNGDRLNIPHPGFRFAAIHDADERHPFQTGGLVDKVVFFSTVAEHHAARAAL